MTDEEQADRRSDTDRELVAAHAHSDQRQGELFPYEQLLEIERQRIDSYNRRTEVANKVVEAQDAADQRQYEYHLKQLETRDAQSQRQHGFARRIFYFGGTFIGVVTALILGMLFFGAPEQSANAQSLLIVLGHAVGGGGALFLLIQAIRWLLSR